MEKQTCENCKYFIEYYLLHEVFFLKARCGQCGKHKKQNFKKLTDSCGSWQAAEDSPANILQSISNTFEAASRRLAVIEFLLRKKDR